MGQVPLALLVLKTHPVDRLRRFYGALGVDLVAQQHGKGPVHYAGSVGDVVLEVYPLPEGDIPADATTRLGFAVASVTDAVATLQADGSAIVTMPQASQKGRRAVVRDPDGRAVELYER